MNTIQELRDMKQKYTDAIEKNGKRILAAAFKEFFKQNPQVEAVRWTQYTPHFNDGDACIFGRNSFEVKLAGAEDTLTDAQKEELQEQNGDDELFMNDYADALPKEVKKAMKEFDDSFEGAGDLFEMVFGDHQKVTATMKGFDTEEYSHD